MVDPSMFGINQQQMQQVQQISGRLRAQIEVDRNNGGFTLRLSAPEGDQEAASVIPGMVGQMAEQMATQLDSFFAIKGEWINVS